MFRILQSKAGNLPTEEPKRRPGEWLPGGIKDIPMLIKDGLDPIHAVYVFMQNQPFRAWGFLVLFVVSENSVRTPAVQRPGGLMQSYLLGKRRKSRKR